MVDRAVSASTMPPGIQLLLELIRQRVRPTQVLLYGSRARGIHRPESDWDLCVVGVQDREGLRDLRIDLAYDPPMLLPVDLVEYESVDPQLRTAIDRDGVPIVD